METETAPDVAPDVTSTPKKPTLTEDQLSFVSLIHQYWMETGGLLTAEMAKSKYGLEPNLFIQWMGFTNVRKALTERGVVFERFNIDGESGNSWTTKALTPVQLVVANTMLDVTDTRSNKKKLQDLGIDTKTYSAWLRDPVFREYLDTRAGNLLKDNAHDVMLALVDKAASGDIKAIEYYHEMNGTFVRQRPGSGPQIDFHGILIRIVEIIAEEVDDPQVAARIADRLKMLGQAQQIASGITGADLTGNDGIVTPEIAKAPELTPSLQKVMASGAAHNV